MKLCCSQVSSKVHFAHLDGGLCPRLGSKAMVVATNVKELQGHVSGLVRIKVKVPVCIVSIRPLMVTGKLKGDTVCVQTCSLSLVPPGSLPCTTDHTQEWIGVTRSDVDNGRW